jgi:hypothetical protein
MREFIKKNSNWYKGNLHMHTQRSDGHVSTAEAIHIYEKKGYDFIAITDHRKPSVTIEPNTTGILDNQEIKMNSMLLLSGVEWDTGGNNTELAGDVDCFHILGIGMSSNKHGRNFGEVEHPEPCEIIETIKKDGGFAVLAHPCWSVMDPASINECEGADAAEIFNAVSGIPWNGERRDSSTWFDIWATHYGILMPAIAGDDTHRYSGDECQSFTMVNAEDLSSASIMKALYDGDFYASQAPTINEVIFDDEKRMIHVECSQDVIMAVFYSNHIWTPERFMHVVDGCVDYHLKKGESYIRIELIRADGKKAWTSPYSVQ